MREKAVGGSIGEESTLRERPLRQSERGISFVSIVYQMFIDVAPIFLTLPVVRGAIKEKIDDRAVLVIWIGLMLKASERWMHKTRWPKPSERLTVSI